MGLQSLLTIMAYDLDMRICAVYKYWQSQDTKTPLLL